jgi:hypothetical protein
LARAVAFVPDLLFGSNVVGLLQASGHDPLLVNSAAGLGDALDRADVLIVDLTADSEARIEAVRPWLGRDDLPTLAFFAHVEADVKAAAEAAGFDLVVPRSRMARAGAALVTELSG